MNIHHQATFLIKEKPLEDNPSYIFTASSKTQREGKGIVGENRTFLKKIFFKTLK